ncbi:ABC-type sugar transport system substrate-binding protein, partial [Marinobacter sp. MBR-105]
MKHSLVRVFRALPVVLILMLNPASDAAAQERTLAYLVPDIRIPFWDIMARGIHQKATESPLQKRRFQTASNLPVSADSSGNAGVDHKI